MNTPYLDEVSQRLTNLLSELPRAEQVQEMSECAAAAGDYLNVQPDYDSPEKFSRSIFSDPTMANLVDKDSENRLAMSAEIPNELVMNLKPSDGHLE